MFTAGSATGTYVNTVRATDGLVSGYATVVIASAPPPDILGTAATFAGLAGSTLTNTGPSTIVGDIGVSPGSAVVDIPVGQPTGGSIHAGDGVAATAMADLTTGYNTLAGMACGTNLTGQDLGGMTLAPGVYCFNTSAQVTGLLTFDAQGDTNAVFVIQMGSTLTTASNSSVVLIGGAKASNLYYQVGSSATLGTNTAFQGSIVALASVTLTTGTSLNGRALGINGAVTLDFNAITLP
jgi:type VI secretion system secreted protein VgrG